MTLRIYVAGASKDMERAEKAMAAVREMGHTITFDWCEAMRCSAQSERDMTWQDRHKYATNDYLGVKNCDVLWLLIPSDGVFSTGCCAELGIAIGRDKDIITSGNDLLCLFTAMANERVATDEEAIAILKEWS